jgi:alanyl-tRNA synthetase
MRKIVNRLTATHQGLSGVFSGNDQEGYKYIAASGSDGRDATLLQKVLKDEYGARGGGNQKMIQGSLPACSIEELVSRCLQI